GEVFTLKRSRDDRDKDQDPSAGSDRERKEGSQARKLSHPEIQGQRKRSLQAPLKMPPNLNISILASNNDEQPTDKEVFKADWFKKLERPPTLDSDWNKRQHVDSRPPQTWINLTQAILVGPAFYLLKVTCKSLTELEYHLEECSKATTERLDWHNLEGKPYPFDLRKPHPLIPDHRGRQVIPQNFFINNNLEYLKGGDLSRRYSTSVTKTKAATYEIKWIEDLVRNLWSPVKVIYDKHAYLGISHWGHASTTYSTEADQSHDR
ncbi:hypothetical protein Tco_1266581, partial [Tanacetum coccineum]